MLHLVWSDSYTLALFLPRILVLLSPELHVKTVKYFKSIERVQDEVEKKQADLKAKGLASGDQQLGSLE